jgi:hypothetical protein
MYTKLVSTKERQLNVIQFVLQQYFHWFPLVERRLQLSRPHLLAVLLNLIGPFSRLWHPTTLCRCLSGCDFLSERDNCLYARCLDRILDK